LWLDDIQHFVLMICNSCGIDDIHASRRDVAHEFKSISKQRKIFFHKIILKAKSFDLAFSYLFSKSLSAKSQNFLINSVSLGSYGRCDGR